MIERTGPSLREEGTEYNFSLSEACNNRKPDASWRYIMPAAAERLRTIKCPEPFFTLSLCCGENCFYCT
jgi:hypothetical protein